MANPDPAPARKQKVENRKARRRRPGTLQEAQFLLWVALERAGNLLERPEPDIALRAVHAVSQGVSAYLRLIEVGHMEERLEELEDQLLRIQAHEPGRQT
ncbi:hypothetical protein [Deinococcus navajonensis]|uniref:Uncharacterized protein n=1 Tax=Deinococcus navajonensis TaxID=309884 RepID=A0ABV8XQM0_9DEIO